MSVVTDIVSSKVFLGHPKSQSNPKTRDARQGVFKWMVVFDPLIIAEQLLKAKEMFQEAKRHGKEVLVICEKELYKTEIEKLAEDIGFSYMNHKIPAWVLTNFDTLLSRIKSLQEMRSYVSSESFQTLTKKEQQMKKRALQKVEKVYKGVVSLRKKPDLVIIVDGQMMHKFVDEVEKEQIDSVILASSNFDIRAKSHVVMCNVNSWKSIDFAMNYICK